MDVVAERIQALAEVISVLNEYEQAHSQYYLSDEYKSILADIHFLATKPEADEPEST